LWYIFLGLFIICIVEGSQIADTNNYVNSRHVNDETDVTSGSIFSMFSSRWLAGMVVLDCHSYVYTGRDMC
jgi:hypothetical protein